MTNCPRHVLVIEDDPGISRLLTAVLESDGYAVTAQETAFGARDLVHRLHPDVILLDLALPYRSGASLLAELKADPNTGSTPVIVVSAFTDCLTAERRAMAADVIPKPFSPRALLAAVRDAHGLRFPHSPSLRLPVDPITDVLGAAASQTRAWL